MSTAAAALILLLVASSAPTTAESQTISPECPASCTGVDIPYPFGIGAAGSGCFREGFEISCTNNGTDLPVLANTSTPVVQLSVDPPFSQVMLPIGYQCYNVSWSSSNNRNEASRNGTSNASKNRMSIGGVHRISNKNNTLVVLGCATVAVAVTKNIEKRQLDSASGCVSFCRDDQAAQDGDCTGMGCCKVDTLPELHGATEFEFLMNARSGRGRRQVLEYSPCDYAFLVATGNYTFRRSDLMSMETSRTMPVNLDWAIRDPSSCPDATDPKYACKSNNSRCVKSTNGPGYTCSCKDGYKGNAYLPDGCTDIKECQNKEKYCFGNDCEEKDGSFKCHCPKGYTVNNNDPYTERCTPDPELSLAAKLAIGITLGISFLLIAVLSTLLKLQRRRTKGFFKKNGGLTLRNVGTLNIFTKEEIKKITKNNSEVLGRGCFGKVYKGILPDGTAVAVKTSIEINKARKEEFTKEVEIQSQMIHKNIIKLIGCCLEVDVPMLVYEFAANGSLQDILHGKTSVLPNFPLDLRLDIAIDAAEGLAYMHSSTTHTIRHGDVKPANILLDDKNMPKISDFGTSKFLTKDKDHTVLVVGSMEYIDPMFSETGQLTQKSDVYNFGVVLLELITRKPIVYDGNRRLIVEFRDVYRKENSGGSMFDKDIATEEDTYILEEIAKLAVMCLRKDVEERPEMKEVAERLAMLRRARKSGNINHKSPQYFEEIGADGAPMSFTSEINN